MAKQTGREAPAHHWSLEAVGLSDAWPVRILAYTHEGDLNPRHEHAFWELTLVIGGAAFHETDGGAAPLEAGQAIAVRPGLFHAFRACASLSILNCVMRPGLFDQELAWLHRDGSVGPLLRVDGGRVRAGEPIVLELGETALARARALLAPVATSRHEPPLHARAGGIGRAAALLSELAAVWARDVGERPAIPGVVRRAAEALEQNPARPWKMQTLAAEVRCSMAYLTRQFSAALGAPPMAYLARIRAERAAAILRQTGTPVAEVGRSVGYPSPEHFSRRFRDQYRQSPSAYRRRHHRAG